MSDRNKTKAQLMAELQALRERVAALETPGDEALDAAAALPLDSRLGTLIIDLAQCLVNVAPRKLDDGIVTGLTRMGVFFQADRACLFQLRDDGRTADNSHEWCAPGVSAQRENLQGLMLDADLPWLAKQLRHSAAVVIPLVADLPEAARGERDHFQAQQIQSLIAIPMMSGSALCGFLGLAAVSKPQDWPREAVALLLIMGDILAGALHRRGSDDERRTLGEQLRHTQKMEAIGHLAGGMAHEINNQLMVVLNCAEFVRDTLHPDSQAAGDIAEIMKAGRRCQDVVRQVLAFSRKQTLAPQLTDLTDVAVSAPRLLGPTLGLNVELTVKPGIGLWQTMVDRRQIEQVLLNLILNARAAMPDGGQITIETANVQLDDDDDERFVDTQDLRPGQYVMLAVTDTGTGMDQELTRHIFEPFFTTRSRANASGLGLSTVYGIVRQHDGFVAVETQPGAGSVFRVYLPRSRPGAVRPDPVSPAAPDIGSPARTVLLVEDEPTVRRTMSRILRQLDFRVVEARDGNHALAQMETLAQPLDLLVADIVMPGIAGTTVARKLRERCPGLRVVLVSGYPETEVLPAGTEHDRIVFIQKPFGKDTLVQTVEKLFAE